MRETEVETLQVTMDQSFIEGVLAALPPYAVVHVEITGHRTQRLMARDRPGPGRRFTNLESGMEWFLPFTFAAVERVVIPSLDITTEHPTRRRFQTLTYEQRRAVQELADYYKVEVDEREFTPSYNLPRGSMSGWIGNFIHVTISPEGEVNSG